jgi:hypothetical protein
VTANQMLELANQSYYAHIVSGGWLYSNYWEYRLLHYAPGMEE